MWGGACEGGEDYANYSPSAIGFFFYLPPRKVGLHGFRGFPGIKFQVLHPPA